jgi:quercetin dioxygenase-like cupin family protein
MKAIRLLNDVNGNSYFEVGTLPEYHKIEVEYFNIQTKIEPYQQHQHKAPRYQFVVTLKGKLEFTTSEGKTFIIEPRIILIAKDTHGEGHSWKIIEGDEWQRIYLVPNQNQLDNFIAD